MVIQTELIKLKVKQESSVGEKALKIKGAFLKACKELDASVFEKLIEEDQYFQELDKYRFLQSLKDEFNTCKQKGFREITMIKGACKGCHLGNQVHQFYTNKTTPSFAYIIHEEENEIIDIFMCNWSSGMRVIDMKILQNYDFWK